MLTSGWKTISMVDVHGKVTFTLWLCGCNLKCPFCHNWLIAEGKECFPLERGALLGDLSSSSFLVDYFHVTGGEPLIQWIELSSLLAEARELLPVSLNTNLTLLKPLVRLLKAELVDHLATDLKAPPTELYGLPTEISKRLWEFFLLGLELISDYGVPLELRIPVARGFEQWPWIEEGLKRIDTNFYVVLNSLVGPPLTNPRDKTWCSDHCWPGKAVEELKESLEEIGIKVYTNDFLGTGAHAEFINSTKEQ